MVEAYVRKNNVRIDWKSEVGEAHVRAVSTCRNAGGCE